MYCQDYNNFLLAESPLKIVLAVNYYTSEVNICSGKLSAVLRNSFIKEDIIF